jgi:excisionase family DNA binding protein
MLSMAKTDKHDNPASLDRVLTILDGDVRLRDIEGNEVVLSADVVEAFQMAVAEMLSHSTADLTTQEAAKLVGVSRPTLIRLLDTGAIPFRRTHGALGHRRILRRDALDYLRADLDRRRRALDTLAEDAAAFGFYDD